MNFSRTYLLVTTVRGTLAACAGVTGQGRGWRVPYGRGSTAAGVAMCVAMSVAMLADLRPALFVAPWPIWREMSLRCLFGGRLAAVVALREAAGFEACLALGGGRFAWRDGEGDDVDGLTPFG